MLVSQDMLALTSQSFPVRAAIVAGCIIGGGGQYGTLDFGIHSGVATADVNAAFVPNGSLSIACTPGVTLNMQIDGGQHYTTVRRMIRGGGAQSVSYRLYRSSTTTAANEITVGQTVAISAGNGNNILLPIN